MRVEYALKTAPLRHCDYVFDTETGLYYLQSRYYDPKMGRFINADAYASTGQGLLGNNMFAYCRNNPIRYVDASGNLPSDIFATCYGYEGYSRTYSAGQAITLTRNNNSVYIEAYMTFQGDVDSEYLIQGIKSYWEGTYSYGDDIINVYVNVYYGESSNGHTIHVNTSSSYGRSYCMMNKRMWQRTKESSITLFEDYYTSVTCDWTIAHEFGHSLGVYDYYKYQHLPGFDSSFSSIMNLPGVHASNADIQKVMFAFISNTYQAWYCIGGGLE